MYGSLLVSLCAQYGTDYCDITGESDWVREMIDLHDEAAKASGTSFHILPHPLILLLTPSYKPMILYPIIPYHTLSYLLVQQ